MKTLKGLYNTIFIECTNESNAGIKIKGRFVRAYYYFNNCRFYFENPVPSAFRGSMDGKILSMFDVYQRIIALRKLGATCEIKKLF